MRLLLFVSSKPRPVQAGFTLLELLVVITVMGILSTVAVMSYDGVQEQGQYDATRFEMTEIRNALLQFRRDSGSNEFPGQGQYDCDNDPDTDTNTPNPALDFPDYVDAYSVEKDKVDWCRHPANFWMLFVDPFGRATHDQWNEDTHRGWHGPYLTRKSGLLNLSAGNPAGLPTQSGIWGIADAYLNYTATGIAWSTLPDPERGGRPYWFLPDTDSDSQPDERIVSLGPDNSYAGSGTDECLPNGNNLILCLLR
jgi:prepilin-type N-terminal cleavage/methylation domain-containing protein